MTKQQGHRRCMLSPPTLRDSLRPSEASSDIQRSWPPTGEKANLFLERKEGHPAHTSLRPRLRGARGEEAACPGALKVVDTGGCLPRVAGGARRREERPATAGSFLKPERGLISLDTGATCGKEMPTQRDREGVPAPEPKWVLIQESPERAAVQWAPPQPPDPGPRPEPTPAHCVTGPCACLCLSMGWLGTGDAVAFCYFFFQ